MCVGNGGTGLQASPAPPPPPASSIDEAQSAINMTPQERFLYGMHVANLNGSGGVDNTDGSRSTLYQSVQPHAGKFYNVPTVWDGKIETEKWKHPTTGQTFDVPNATALKNVEKIGWDKFPSFATPQEADARYEAMHSFMEKDTAKYLSDRAAQQKDTE